MTLRDDGFYWATLKSHLPAGKELDLRGKYSSGRFDFGQCANCSLPPSICMCVCVCVEGKKV